MEYTELVPQIIASGAGEYYPSWDYRQTKNCPIAGCKFMHILLKTPKNLRPIKAAVTVTAKLRAYGSLMDTILGLGEGGDTAQASYTWNLLD